MTIEKFIHTKGIAINRINQRNPLDLLGMPFAIENKCRYDTIHLVGFLSLKGICLQKIHLIFLLRLQFKPIEHYEKKTSSNCHIGEIGRAHV